MRQPTEEAQPGRQFLNVSLAADGDLYDEIKQIAEREERSMSQVVRRILRQYVDANRSVA